MQYNFVAFQKNFAASFYASQTLLQTTIGLSETVHQSGRTGRVCTAVVCSILSLAIRQPTVVDSKKFDPDQV